jgi:hypothetical protein
MNRGIKRIQGIDYSTGTTSNHAGASDEYMFFDHHIFAFDLECGTAFQPPRTEAVLAAREVAEAVRALGWCATGRTGLDIADLLARRAPLLDSNVPPETIEPSSGPWHVPDLPEEQWRRFVVHCHPLSPSRRRHELQALLEMGLDLGCVEMAEGPLDLIVSATDLVSLVRHGYQPIVCADLLAECNHENKRG